jgi:hypothetical protein
LDARTKQIGIALTIAMMVVLGFVFFAITAPSGGISRKSTSSSINSTGPNGADLLESATLTEPTGSSSALFTLFVGNLGNSTFESISVYLVGPNSQHWAVLLGQSSLQPHGTTSAQLSVGFSCVIGQAYAYVLGWVAANTTYSKQSMVTCSQA